MFVELKDLLIELSEYYDVKSVNIDTDVSDDMITYHIDVTYADESTDSFEANKIL